MISETMQWVTAEAMSLVTANLAFIGPIVFALGFAESIVVLSFFVPSTVLFLAIGGLHHAAGGTFWEVWLWGAAGAFCGDVLSYAAGRFFKEDIAGVWPFSAKPEWYLMARNFESRWGFMGIVGSKFLGMLRPFVPLAAGAMRMPWPVFVAASALSALLWAGVFLSPGYGLGYLMK